jgi:hypothetical protein
MKTRLREFFNKEPRIGILATTAKNGQVNAACFGSPYMPDDERVVMGLGENRTLRNLQENPHAVFLVVQPGKTMAQWKGARFYLQMNYCDRHGERLEEIRSRIEKMAGDAAARTIVASVTFRIKEVRPLVDLGQGWEKAIS